ncbi:vomeronasal type-2 receptor 26-like [Rhinophrynus dorsalis]
MVDTTICPDDVDYPRCGLDPVMERAECVTSSDCKTGTKCCFSGCRRRCLQPLQDKKGSCPQFKKTLCNFQTPIPYDECQTDRQCPGSSKCCSKCRKECTRVLALSISIGHPGWIKMSSLEQKRKDELHKCNYEFVVKCKKNISDSMKRFLQVLLLFSCLGDGYPKPACRLQGWETESFYQAGDVIIGGVFVVHSDFNFPQLTFQDRPKPIACKGFHIRYYRDVLGLMFAIDEINKSPDLLPNITLGFSLIDSCMSELRAIGGALSVMSGIGNPIPRYDCHAPAVMVGIVGELVSALSLPIARILGVLHYPQISHGSTLSALSNKVNFPSFLRTVPSNMFQNIALTQLISLFGWIYVGMLVVDNDVGEQGGQVIQAGIEQSGSCVAFLEKIHLSYSAAQIQRVVNVIKKSPVNVIVLHSPEVHVKTLLDALYDENVTDKIFISSASFGLTPGIFSKKAWKVLNGTIGLIPNTGTMPGFLEFLQNLHPLASIKYPFIRLVWQKAFNCRWSDGETRENQTDSAAMLDGVPCSRKEDLGELISALFEINDLSYTFHAYLAVYAYAQALHSLLMCDTWTEDLQKGPCRNVTDTEPWKVLHHLKKIHFYTKSGELVSFNADGDIPAAYDIINVQIVNNNFNLVKVGNFDPEASVGDKITINISSILWNDNFSQVPLSACSTPCRPGYRKAARQGQPICCFDCVPCSAGEMSNKTDAVECFKCPSDQWSNEEKDMCIPKVIEFLSYQEPLGIMLVTIILLFAILTLCIIFIFIKHRKTPIIKATNRELSYILLVSLVLCFLCSLGFIGRPSQTACLLRQTFFSVVFSISISSVLAKTITVILAFKATRFDSPLRKWLGPQIPRSIVGLCTVMQTGICSTWLLISPPYPKLNMEIEMNKVIFECHEGQNLFFYVTLGFMGFLAMMSLLFAFLARNLPGSYNEAKLITFSMLVFCSVWISFIPAHLSTKGKYMVAVQIFAILASSAGLLGCIFVPKCYIILFQPERNNRECLGSGGYNDTIIGGYNDVVLGGNNDMILGGYNDVVLGGYIDMILGGYKDVVLGGYNDEVFGGYNDVMLGGYNDVVLRGYNDVILGGGYNDVIFDGYNDVVLGGYNDVILDGYNDMVLGDYNEVILGGYNDVVLGGYNDVLFGGYNDVLLVGYNDVILGGYNNVVFCGYNDVIFGDYNDVVLGGYNYVVLRGCNYVIPHGYSDVGLGGYNDVILGGYNYVDLGGYNDVLLDDYNDVLHGGYNDVVFAGYIDVFLGGYNDVVLDGFNDVLLGGYNGVFLGG